MCRRRSPASPGARSAAASLAPRAPEQVDGGRAEQVGAGLQRDRRAVDHEVIVGWVLPALARIELADVRGAGPVRVALLDGRGVLGDALVEHRLPAASL